MKPLRLALFALMLCILPIGFAQSSAPAKKKTTVEFVKDVTSMLASQYSSPAALRQKANQIARMYQDSLKSIGKQVQKVSTEATNRLSGMGFQDKLNVALELWRIRSSLDLLTLVSPEVFHDLTGMYLPDLKDLSAKFAKSEAQIQSLLPWKM